MKKVVLVLVTMILLGAMQSCEFLGFEESKKEIKKNPIPEKVVKSDKMEVKFRNLRKESIWIVGRYMPRQGEKVKWINTEFMEVKSGDCVSLFRTKNKTFYVYAESRKSNGNFDSLWKGDHSQKVKNRAVQMMKLNISKRTQPGMAYTITMR